LQSNYEFYYTFTKKIDVEKIHEFSLRQ